MNSVFRIATVTSLLLLVSGLLFAQDRATAIITSKAPKPAQVDSAVPELAGIVVLCATEPESKSFKNQWRNYVRKQKVSESELGAIIFRVINDAEAQRGNQRLEPRRNARCLSRPPRKNLSPNA